MDTRLLALRIGVSLLASLPAASQNVPASDAIRAPRWLRSPINVSVNYSSLMRYQSGPGISVSKDFWRGLGAEADFSDYFYRGYSSSQPYSNGFSFLLGPRFSVTPGAKGSGRLTLFSHALVGKVRGREYACNYLEITINGITTRCSQFNYRTAPETALGGGADIRLSSHFGVRLAQIDYVHAFYPSEHQGYVRLSTGGVFFLGAVSQVPRITRADLVRISPSEVFVGPSAVYTPRVGFGGLQFALTYDLRWRFGLTVDFGCQYRGHSGDRVWHCETMAGPQFTLRRRNVTAFAHAIPGVIWDFGALGTEFGGGVDLAAGKRVAIRVAQFDYTRWKAGFGWTYDVRLGFGVVVKLRRRQTVFHLGQAQKKG